MDPGKLIIGGCLAVGLALVGVFWWASQPAKSTVAPLPVPAVSVSAPSPVPEVAPPDTPPFAAEPVRFDFKGDTPGVMSLDEFHAKYADAEQSRLGGRHVDGAVDYVLPRNSEITIAAVDVHRATYRFLDGRLRRIELQLLADEEQVREALTKKHGPPVTVKTEPRGEVQWSTTASSIAIGHLSDVVFSDTSLERVYDERLSEAFARERAAKAKAAEADL